MKARQHLEAIFEADRKAASSERALLENKKSDALVETLVNAVDEAMSQQEPDEAVMRVRRLSDLCAQVEGPRMADAIIRMLDHDNPAARVAAGEALRDVAYDRYAEVARAIERRLESGLDGLALEEIPWVLAEVGEPSAGPLIADFLGHAQVDVVAAAIEALVELGDRGATEALEALRGDQRVATLEEGDASYSTSIDELVDEAIDELSGGSDED